ncbi:hypothetical protein Tco_1071943 [Tanacetum coccineum]
MDLMHSTPSMYYDYDAHVKGELLVIMKNSQSVNLLIFISNTLIELFNEFGSDRDGILKRPTMYFNLWIYKVVRHRYSNPMIQPEPEGSTQTEMELTLEQTQQGVSYEVSVSPMVVAARFFRYSDTVRLSRSDEVLKLKNFKKDATLKLFKSTNQERYKHVGPEVTSSQDGKVTRWRNEIMLG